MQKPNYVYDIHKKMQEFKIMLAYEGEFSQEITKSVLAMTEKNLDTLGEDMMIKRKVFNVMVECLQNVVKHSENKAEEYKAAIFLIGFDSENYVVSTGNLLNIESSKNLKLRLIEINNLDKEGLKQLHKEVSANTEKLSEKAGAGLGLIDIARKSGKKLEFDFYEVNSSSEFFSLSIKIPRIENK